MAENVIKSFVRSVNSWAYSGNSLDPHEKALAERQKKLAELQNYYSSRQRRPLKISPGGKDYNVLTNLTGIIISRTVSMLVGAGVEFNLDDDAAQAKLDEIYTANRGDIYMHNLTQFGSVYGTAFVKIVPDGIEYMGKAYPRLVPLNPFNMVIAVQPDDINHVTAYIFRWDVGDDAYREVTKNEDGKWIIYVEKSSRDTRWKWERVGDEVVWDYEWPPIHHCQNLPSAGEVYGQSDIEGIIELQDKYNAGQSDINTILGNNAFPLRYVRGGKLPRRTLSNGQQVLDITPARILEFSNESAEMGVAEMESDLSSSRAFVSDIRRDIFDVAGAVDTETLRANAHQITNFGLRVMYKDELAKNATKQMLYGALFDEVNRHLLEMAGMPDAGLGKIIWGDPLPENEQEEVQTLQADMNMGIVSQQTAAQKRGYDYEVESDRIKEEATTKKQLGGDLLRDFLAGRNE